MSEQFPLGFPTLPELADPGFRDALQRDIDDLSRGLGTAVAASTSVTPWTGVGSAPAFQNGWVNVGGGTAVTAFYKDRLGNVTVKGHVTTGTAGTAVFTLPTGYRPLERYDFAITRPDTGAASMATILSTGDVIPTGGAGNTHVSLDGISFRAEQ